MPRDRILIFNFFAGVMDRGIPVYAQELATAMRNMGYEVQELRCPLWFRRAPRALHNLLFVMFEQLVAPLIRIARGCSVTVYPYNSSGMLDAMLGRAILVVHDLISNERKNTRPAALYIRLAQAWHRCMKRPVCAASAHTLKQLRRLKVFGRCELSLWSNPFYAFEAAVRRASSCGRNSGASGPRVLLCSGMGANKDYAGAITRFRQCSAMHDVELRVIGFGDDAHLAQRRINKLPDALRTRVRVLGRLSLDELATEFVNSDFVWVHSTNEGFGRPVLEALIARRPVVASNISAFRAHRRPGVHLYGEGEFPQAVRFARSSPALIDDMFIHAYHAEVEAKVLEVLSTRITPSKRLVNLVTDPGADLGR